MCVTDPMWKVLKKELDLAESTSFLDHVNLVCTQREFETSKDIEDNYRNMFESGSLQEQKKNCFVQGNLAQTSSLGPMLQKVMQRNVWSDIVSW